MSHHGLGRQNRSPGRKERGDPGKRGVGLYMEALIGGRQRF